MECSVFLLEPISKDSLDDGDMKSGIQNKKVEQVLSQYFLIRVSEKSAGWPNRQSLTSYSQNTPPSFFINIFNPTVDKRCPTVLELFSSADFSFILLYSHERCRLAFLSYSKDNNNKNNDMWSLQESHYKHITVDELLFNEIVNYLKRVLKVSNITQRGFFCTIIFIFDY